MPLSSKEVSVKPFLLVEFFHRLPYNIREKRYMYTCILYMFISSMMKSISMFYSKVTIFLLEIHSAGPMKLISYLKLVNEKVH